MVNTKGLKVGEIIMKKILSILLTAVMILAMTACSTGRADNKEETNTAGKKETKEVQTINLSWGNEMHTGIMYLPFLAPELFEK